MPVFWIDPRDYHFLEQLAPLNPQQLWYSCLQIWSIRCLGKCRNIQIQGRCVFLRVVLILFLKKLPLAVFDLIQNINLRFLAKPQFLLIEKFRMTILVRLDPGKSISFPIGCLSGSFYLSEMKVSLKKYISYHL